MGKEIIFKETNYCLRTIFNSQHTYVDHLKSISAIIQSRFALISGQWSGQVLGSPALASPDLVNYATGDSNLTSPGLISRPFLSRIALGRHRLAPAPSSRSPTHRSPPALLLSFHFNRGALCWFCSIGKRKLEKCSGFVGPLVGGQSKRWP